METAPPLVSKPAQNNTLHGGARGPVLRTRKEFVDYVQKERITHVVAYEFSGGIVNRLRAKGIKAISIDVRKAEHDGPHYQGDVWDVIDAVEWEVAYFVGPPCYQHLRKDHCLPRKIADGRAFWGGAEVIKCLCLPNAKVVIVEQPDTIFIDYLDLSLMPDVKVINLVSSWLGDTKRKYVKLLTRNALLPPIPDEANRPVVVVER